MKLNPGIWTCFQMMLGFAMHQPNGAMNPDRFPCLAGNDEMNHMDEPTAEMPSLHYDKSSQILTPRQPRSFTTVVTNLDPPRRFDNPRYDCRGTSVVMVVVLALVIVVSIVVGTSRENIDHEKAIESRTAHCKTTHNMCRFLTAAGNIKVLASYDRRFTLTTDILFLYLLFEFSTSCCGALQVGFGNYRERCLPLLKPHRVENVFLNGRLHYSSLEKLNAAATISPCMMSKATEVEGSCDGGIVSWNWTSPTLAIAIPALVGMIADPLLSLMDTVYVSQLGSVELAALGPCTSIFHLAFNAFRATTAATTSLISAALCLQGDEGTLMLHPEANNTTSAPIENARDILSTTMFFFMLMGVLISCILISTSKAALSCMGVPPSSALYPHAMSYLKIRALAAPAVLLITVSEGAFRGYCDTRTPLIASLTAAIVNVIFDPILMFKPLKMGVSGAAAATAGSQISAMLVYLNVIHKRKMVRYSLSSSPVKHQQIKNKRRKVIYTILRANVSMLMKQFSLLVAWSYATSRATSIGHVHVAAHQITLSLWLLFALVQDGLAVAAQVLMSRTTSLHSKRSLTFYMVKASVLQSILCSLIIYLLRGFLPVFSKDSRVLEKLQLLMPVLIAFQPLVSATLVMESIVVGGNCFLLLAFGTFVATVGSMVILRKAESVVSIWMYGLTSLFIGRFIVAIIGVLYLNGLRWPKSWKRKNIQQPIPPPIDFDSQT